MTDLAGRLDACFDASDARVGAVVADRDGADVSVRYERAPDDQFRAASTIKVLVAYALYAGDRDPGTVRTVTPENRVPGGVFGGLSEPRATLADLARAMLVVSDNAAANELADVLGFEAINRAADRLGLGGTRFGRKMLADDGRNLVTPRDCVRLLHGVECGDGLDPDERWAIRDALDAVDDRAHLCRYLPFDAPVRHKPGWLPDAAVDAAVVDDSLYVAVCADGDYGAAVDAVAAAGEIVWNAR